MPHHLLFICYSIVCCISQHCPISSESTFIHIWPRGYKPNNDWKENNVIYHFPIPLSWCFMINRLITLCFFVHCILIILMLNIHTFKELILWRDNYHVSEDKCWFKILNYITLPCTIFKIYIKGKRLDKHSIISYFRII